MYHQPWDRFARKIGRDLLQLSSTDNRSMNVTLQRENGAQEGEQKHLAKHMSHSHGIQTKRYNSENKVSERHSIEVSDRHRALPRFSMNSNLSSGKQVAESSQSGLSSSEKEAGHLLTVTVKVQALKLPLALEGSCHPPRKGGSYPPQKGT